MSVDYIRYDILTQEALRGVVRTVLIDAAKNGLPGDHHFYISFDTRAEGVRLSPRLAALYPEEMTIVLQHQFWDLITSDHGFEVGLSFNGIPERLVVPFAAIKGFVDPSVQFGLQFEVLAGVRDETDASPDTAGELARTPARHERPAGSAEPPLPVPANPAPPATTAADPSDEPAKPPGSGEVVKFDRFRKK